MSFKGPPHKENIKQFQIIKEEKLKMVTEGQSSMDNTWSRAAYWTSDPKFPLWVVMKCCQC